MCSNSNRKETMSIRVKSWEVGNDNRFRCSGSERERSLHGGEEERRGEERKGEERGDERRGPRPAKRNSPTCTHAMANWQIHVCLRAACLQSASRRYKRLGTHAGKLQFSLGRLKYRDGKHEDQGRVSRKRYYWEGTNLRESRVGERGAGRDEERRREEREKVAVGINRGLFSKACFARKNWRELYERWEPASP